jgi:hypothetical protein
MLRIPSKIENVTKVKDRILNWKIPFSVALVQYCAEHSWGEKMPSKLFKQLRRLMFQLLSVLFKGLFNDLIKKSVDNSFVIVYIFHKKSNKIHMQKVFPENQFADFTTFIINVKAATQCFF